MFSRGTRLVLHGEFSVLHDVDRRMTVGIRSSNCRTPPPLHPRSLAHCVAAATQSAVDLAVGDSPTADVVQRSLFQDGLQDLVLVTDSANKWTDGLDTDHMAQMARPLVYRRSGGGGGGTQYVGFCQVSLFLYNVPSGCHVAGQLLSSGGQRITGRSLTANHTERLVEINPTRPWTCTRPARNRRKTLPQGTW